MYNGTTRQKGMQIPSRGERRHRPFFSHCLSRSIGTRRAVCVLIWKRLGASRTLCFLRQISDSGSCATIRHGQKHARSLARPPQNAHRLSPPCAKHTTSQNTRCTSMQSLLVSAGSPTTSIVQWPRLSPHGPIKPLIASASGRLNGFGFGARDAALIACRAS
jgi:hypothetical protein